MSVSQPREMKTIHHVTDINQVLSGLGQRPTVAAQIHCRVKLLSTLLEATPQRYVGELRGWDNMGKTGAHLQTESHESTGAMGLGVQGPR